MVFLQVQNSLQKFYQTCTNPGKISEALKILYSVISSEDKLPQCSPNWSEDQLIQMVTIILRSSDSDALHGILRNSEHQSRTSKLLKSWQASSTTISEVFFLLCESTAAFKQIKCAYQNLIKLYKNSSKLSRSSGKFSKF